MLGQREVCVLGGTERTPLRDHLSAAVQHEAAEGVTVRTRRLARTGLHRDRVVSAAVAAVAHHRAVHGREWRDEGYAGIEQRDRGSVDAGGQ